GDFGVGHGNIVPAADAAFKDFVLPRVKPLAQRFQIGEVARGFGALLEAVEELLVNKFDVVRFEPDDFAGVHGIEGLFVISAGEISVFEYSGEADDDLVCVLAAGCAVNSMVEELGEVAAGGVKIT